MVAHITDSLRTCGPWWAGSGPWWTDDSIGTGFSILQGTAVNGFAFLLYVCSCVGWVVVGVYLHSVYINQRINLTVSECQS